MLIQAGNWDIGAITQAINRSKYDEGGDVKGDARDAVELVGGCLERDPRKRWTVGDVLGYRWLRGTREGLMRELRDRGEEVGTYDY